MADAIKDPPEQGKPGLVESPQADRFISAANGSASTRRGKKRRTICEALAAWVAGGTLQLCMLCLLARGMSFPSPEKQVIPPLECLLLPAPLVQATSRSTPAAPPAQTLIAPRSKPLVEPLSPVSPNPVVPDVEKPAPTVRKPEPPEVSKPRKPLLKKVSSREVQPRLLIDKPSRPTPPNTPPHDIAPPANLANGSENRLPTPETRPKTAGTNPPPIPPAPAPSVAQPGSTGVDAPPLSRATSVPEQTPELDAYLRALHTEIQRTVKRERGFSLRGSRSEERGRISLRVGRDGLAHLESIGNGISADNADLMRRTLNRRRFSRPPEIWNPDRAIVLPIIITGR